MFEATQFLREHFATPAGVTAFLQAYSSTAPSAATTDKWFQRNKIPAEWLPLLLGYLEIDRGAPVALSSYLRGT